MLFRSVVNGLTVTNPAPQALQIPIASLTGSATDADGDSLALAGFDATTTNGVALSSDGTYLYYSNNANVADRFNYTISDGRGGSTTGAAQIAPAPVTAPSITSGPTNLTVIAGQDAAFSVTAGGTAPLSYQWRFNGVNISGATAANYTRVSAQTNDAGPYVVVVTNSAGSITSATATLTVNYAPLITAQPQSQSVKAGTNVTFTVTAAGAPAPAYQWRFNDSPIAGATDSSYTRANVQTNDAGSYSVLVTNVAGSTTSSNATLTITLLQPFQFQSAELLPGGNLRLVVTGESGGSAWLDWSTNLTDWGTLTNFTCANGTFEFIDGAVTNFSQGFYRVRQ